MKEQLLWEEKGLEPKTNSKNSTENGECVTTGSMSMKSDEKGSNDITGEKTIRQQERLRVYKKEWNKKNAKRVHNKWKEKYEQEKEKFLKYQREYYLKNKERVKNKTRKYYYEHHSKNIKKQNQYAIVHKPEKRKYDKKYYVKNEKKIRYRIEKYRKNNLDKINGYLKNKRKTDIDFKLQSILRHQFLKAVKRSSRCGSGVRDLGCSIKKFKQYIATKFQSGMSWKNHGEWHLDHIVPLSKFNLTDRTQFLIASHYTNYQPLWAKDNIRKSDIHVLDYTQGIF